jgi:acetylornithine/N-succinyldiaminopimelate aminotransferase
MDLFDVYPLFDVSIVRAKGSNLWDNMGKKYLDLYGGHAVISIGHSHPHYIKKIKEQLDQIGFYSNSIKITQQHELSNKIGELSGYSDYQLFLCNSGAEANENAIKLASFHTGRKKVIAFTKSFHGRTSLAVAATDDKSIIAPVNETENIQFTPLNDEKAFEKIINKEFCAVIVEAIQGVGGINIPDVSFLKKIEALCQQNGVVLILDEVQSGYGRSGKFFAHQYAGIRPQIITTAKGMGNGFPVASLLISPEIKPKQGLLGTTFGGNYLACAAAIAVLDVIKQENLIEHTLNIGKKWMSDLKKIKEVKEVRGLGLMIGVELNIPCTEIRSRLLTEYGIFTGAASNKNVLRLLPALTIGQDDIDIFNRAFIHTLSKSAAII